MEMAQFPDEAVDRAMADFNARWHNLHQGELATVKILLVDATNDTNSERYNMFSFMVHDFHGRGQHVQHALMTDERVGSMRDRIGKTLYGLDSIQRERLKPIAGLIVRATSEDVYKSCFGYIKQELETKDGEVPWARYKKKQFITGLCRVGRVVDMVQHTNPELDGLAQIVSKHAYDFIEEQFKVAVSTKTYENTKCVIDGTTWKSFYMLGRTRKLPCRHVMYLRKLLKLETIILFGYIPDHWCFNSETMLQQFLQKDFEICGYSVRIVDGRGNSRTKTQTEKYAKANRNTR
ncbi:Hypothetical protein PHPALM_13918 [Phytophthora palmivora]|uniref:ZSWIM1/3 RNaseH-like domain-containing protein n=1 Tax=Phytophthora palmivora TaxID=4796 RepID=A0A2P4XW42_9STRA|nr:Hypothetical protein PHPALM_13918 [Phytophthora palmivora]